MLSSLLVHIILLLNEACTWFLKIALYRHLYVCMRVCMYMCLPPRLLISGMMWHDIDHMIEVDIVSRRGWLCIEARHKNQPNKNKLVLYKLLL